MVDARRVRPVMRAVAFAAIAMVVFLAVQRWRASAALEDACERTAALGLRLEEGALEFTREPAEVEFIQRLGAWRAEFEEASEARYIRLDGEGLDVDAVLLRGERETAADKSEELLSLAADFGALGVRLPTVHLLEEGQFQDDDRTELYCLSKLLEAAALEPSQGDELRMRLMAASARVSTAFEDGPLLTFHYRLSRLQGLARACDELEALAGKAAADEARAAVRDELGEFDLVESCRIALRREAAASLDYYADSVRVPLERNLLARMTSGLERDLTELHNTWTDLIEASDLPSKAARDTRLAEIDERVRGVPIERVPLTKMLLPNVASTWKSVDDIAAKVVAAGIR